MNRDDAAPAGDEPALKAARINADLLGIVSHDIRSPLGVILGALSELTDPRMGALTDDQRNLLRLVRRSSERLSRLAANVQFLARTAAAPLALSRQPLDARDLARRAADLFERSGETAKISVVLHVPGERAEIDAEPDLAVQSIVNVLANAVRFARREVAVTVASDAATTTLVIEDDGPGFPPETIPRLFDPRASPSPDGGAMPRGLGLLVAKSILDAHGGTIAAETRLGDGGRPAGALVRVSFPRPAAV